MRFPQRPKLLESDTLKINNDFSMAEFEEIALPQWKGKIEKNREVVFNGGCSITVVRTVVVREERVRLPPPALFANPWRITW